MLNNLYLLGGSLLLIIIIWFLVTRRKIGYNKRKNYNYRKVKSLTNGCYLLEEIEFLPNRKNSKSDAILCLAKIVNEGESNQHLGTRYKIKIPDNLANNKQLRRWVKIGCCDTNMAIISTPIRFPRYKTN